MKIIFEINDYVEVEDNSEAGELSACYIQLVEKLEEGNWMAKNLDFSWGPDHNKLHVINERYFLI